MSWFDIDARPVPPRRERVVVTLTTVPERLPYLNAVLRSLLDQSCPADRIILAWPTVSKRSGQRYPAAPVLPDGVELLRCDDFGPSTKLLPALRDEPAALLIVVDDDVIYPRHLIRELLAAHRLRPRAALGWRGWHSEEGVDPRDFRHVFATGVSCLTPVDVLLGTWGYLLPPGSLDEAVHAIETSPDGLRWVDDVWVSGHLARRGIERFVVPAKNLPIETGASRIHALSRGPNGCGGNDAAALAFFKECW